MSKEFAVPINVTESLVEGAPQYIVCKPQLSCTIDEAFIDGDSYRLDVPLSVIVGQLVRFPVPSKYKKESVCGVFATVQSEDIGLGKTETHRVPMGGELYGEYVPADAIMRAQTSASVSFVPGSYSSSSLSRFKRLELRASGDVSKLFLDDIRIGVHSQLIAAGAIPFAMALREDAFNFPEILSAGVMLSLIVSNRGTEDVTLTGNLIFEEVPVPSQLPHEAAVEKQN